MSTLPKLHGLRSRRLAGAIGSRGGGGGGFRRPQLARRRAMDRARFRRPQPHRGDGAGERHGRGGTGSGSEEVARWPGDSVFRLIVPVLKVGSIIGRKGELINKICEETRARVRILDGPVGTTDRVVLISGREPEEELPPAMDAVLRVFKRVNGITEDDGQTPASGHLLFVALGFWLRQHRPLI